MLAAEIAVETDLSQPYPGLRPFESEEVLKFYGREAHTAELLRRLSENRFIAVVGNSGSGKSSLVRAGLLPALYRGRLLGATSQWRICIMRPGETPTKALARALSEQSVFSADETAVLAEINRSSLGLVRAVRFTQFAPGESLLLVVDQFEELFRFAHERKEQDGGAEARLFVASLLEAADLSSAPVYVVLTMRSDFLGDCSQFPGLPEGLNRGQYLIPRMTREQLRTAIEKPLRLAGARMTSRLVELLLNELGDDTGQLPVLQHALNRTFHEWNRERKTSEVGVEHYAAAGEMRGALNAHAESLLDAAGEQWTEKVFRCLTTVERGRRVRRPTRLDRLLKIVDAPDETAKKKVLDVIGIYSHPDHAMLVWSGKDLTEESVIDIAHESLIEHWSRLKGWVTAEQDASSLYHAAALDAAAKRRGAAAQWRSRKLAEARDFLQNGPWNQAWAARLQDSDTSLPDFSEVKNFVESEAEAENAEDAARESIRRRELNAERHAKEDAETLAAAERRAKEDAEARAEAEARAKIAERRAKRWIVFGGVLLLGLFGLGLWDQYGRRAALEAQKKLATATDLAATLRSQIDASDQLLKENRKKEQDLKDQIAAAGRSSEAKQLKSKLEEVVNQNTQIQSQRSQAEAKLSVEARNGTRINPIDGLTYVFIPPGSFLMGCSPGDNECYNDEKPPKTVQIPSGFWIGQTEVTQAAWLKVMSGKSPSKFKGDRLPVERVTFDQADDYCRKIGGSLPTEQQWEYAARAGSTAAPYGSLDAVAWYSGNSGNTTHPVGQKQANAFGLYDMLGNVWEWTSSEYAPGLKVVRGGSWYNDSRLVRASLRSRDELATRGDNLGFRCAGDILSMK